MREKKRYMVLAFHTTTEAMAAEKKCQENHIPGRLIPTPREITAGCGLAWKMPIEDYRLCGQKMKEQDIHYQSMVELIL